MTRTTQITIEMDVKPDDSARPEDDLFQDPDYQEEDKMRIKAWRQGAWHYVGVRAKARIKIPHGKGSWILAHLTSPGLWGIESDRGHEYFQEVFEEERDTLIEMLNSLKTYELVS